MGGALGTRLLALRLTVPANAKAVKIFMPGGVCKEPAPDEVAYKKSFMVELAARCRGDQNVKMTYRGEL